MNNPTREQSFQALRDAVCRMETESLADAAAPGGIISELGDLPVMRREEPALAFTQFNSGLPPKT